MTDTTLTPTPATFAETALADLDAWFNLHGKDTPLAQNTPAYNAVFAALMSIRQILSEL